MSDCEVVNCNSAKLFTQHIHSTLYINLTVYQFLNNNNFIKLSNYLILTVLYNGRRCIRLSTYFDRSRELPCC